ncbi:MAG: thiopurine S-methyltransferase [Parashewanella sp.]
MQDEWLSRWEENRIGFHKSEVNKYLTKHWHKVVADCTAPVFVPLCGKSLDLMWLQQTHQVIGCELSEIAVNAFFDEQGLTPQVDNSLELPLWQDQQISIYQGDYFKLPQTKMDFKFFYDRAALIALPESLRKEYVEKLITLSPNIENALLVTLEYDQEKADGAPYSVEEKEVIQLFSDHFYIEVLDFEMVETPPSLMKQGITEMKEIVYLLNRK